MPQSKKHVCRLDVWIDPAFDARLAREGDIVLEVGALGGSDAAISRRGSSTPRSGRAISSGSPQHPATPLTPAAAD